MKYILEKITQKNKNIVNDISFNVEEGPVVAYFEKINILSISLFLFN